MSNNSKYSVVILAAGMSSRFGQTKAFLKWDSENTFLEKICSTYYESEIHEGYLVVNDETYIELKKYPISKFHGFSIIINSFPEKGRLYSLKLAIEQMKSFNSCFIQNIDNPFVNINLISELIKNMESNDYLVPNFNGQNGHPALISKKVLTKIANSDYNLGIKAVLNNFEKKILSIDDKSILYNINTLDEYKSIF